MKYVNPQTCLLRNQQAPQPVAVVESFGNLEYFWFSGEKVKSAFIPRCFKDRFAATDLGELKLGDYSVALG